MAESLAALLEGLRNASLPEKEKAPEKPPPRATRITDLYCATSGARLDSFKACQELLGEVRRGETVHVISHGTWAMEEPLAHLLDLMGPADLHIMTWAVAERSVLRLAEALRQGFIRQLRAVIDDRQAVVRPEPLDVLRESAGPGNVGVAPCHAKAYVLEAVDPEGPAYTLVGSANLTQNPRPEATVITESRQVAAFYRGWIEEELERGAAKALLARRAQRTERGDGR